jgi:Domain of unknown function (DUF1127).
MMERFLRMFRLSRDLHDIEAMSDAELADLGVSRAEALALAALPDDVPTRVTEMAKVFGIASEELLADRRLWHELLHSCSQCHDLATCHRFMARAEPEEPVDRASLGFCPNRHTFDSLSRALAG